MAVDDVREAWVQFLGDGNVVDQDLGQDRCQARDRSADRGLGDIERFGEPFLYTVATQVGQRDRHGFVQTEDRGAYGAESAVARRMRARIALGCRLG